MKQVYFKHVAIYCSECVNRMYTHILPMFVNRWCIFIRHWLKPNKAVKRTPNDDNDIIVRQQLLILSLAVPQQFNCNVSHNQYNRHRSVYNVHSNVRHIHCLNQHIPHVNSSQNKYTDIYCSLSWSITEESRELLGECKFWQTRTTFPVFFKSVSANRCNSWLNQLMLSQNVPTADQDPCNIKRCRHHFPYVANQLHTVNRMEK